VDGLTDRSRRPYRYANQLPFQVEDSWTLTIRVSLEQPINRLQNTHRGESVNKC
jgi:hypothetical protein